MRRPAVPGPHGAAARDDAVESPHGPGASLWSRAVDVVLPVLDEVDAIPWVLGRVPQGFRAIVVDNGSADGSADVARRGGALVVEEPRRGFGAACFAGLGAATAPVVCFMDCDGSLDPADLHALIEPIIDGGADLVLGARDPDPGAWPLHARLANRWLARQITRRTNCRLSDLGPMRAARRADLVDLDLQDRRSGWPLEMVLRAAAEGWHIAELPVRYRARRGHSKVTGTIGGTMRAVHDMRGQLRSHRTTAHRR
jgi:glycosyltransferase involved in cell wall biosynthesis